MEVSGLVRGETEGEVIERPTSADGKPLWIDRQRRMLWC